jgi:hypothetical protein
MKYLKLFELFELKGDISNFIISDFKESFTSELRSENEKPNYDCEVINKLNNDKIEINFVRFNNKTWHIIFSVNGKHDSSPDKKYTLKEYVNLITLVAHVISNFCRKFNPNVLMLKGNTDKKIKIYKEIFSKIKDYYIKEHPFIKDNIMIVKKSLPERIKNYLLNCFS